MGRQQLWPPVHLSQCSFKILIAVALFSQLFEELRLRRRRVQNDLFERLVEILFDFATSLKRDDTIIRKAAFDVAETVDVVLWFGLSRIR